MSKVLKIPFNKHFADNWQVMTSDVRYHILDVGNFEV